MKYFLIDIETEATIAHAFQKEFQKTLSNQPKNNKREFEGLRFIFFDKKMTGPFSTMAAKRTAYFWCKQSEPHILLRPKCR